MQCPGRRNIFGLPHDRTVIVCRENAEYLVEFQPFCKIIGGDGKPLAKMYAVAVQQRQCHAVRHLECRVIFQLPVNSGGIVRAWQENRSRFIAAGKIQ